MKTSVPCFLLLVLLLVGLSDQQISPQIMDFTRPANVPEDPRRETVLAEILPGPNSIAIGSCDVKSKPNGPFDAAKKCSSNFCVYYNAKSDLQYKATNFYELTVTCYGSNKFLDDKKTLFVYVQPNLAPVITNYRSDSATINSKTFPFPSGIAYTLVVKDPENDPVTIQLTSQVPKAIFALDPTDITKVKVTKDLRCVTEASYMLTFSVSDGTNIIDDFKVAITLDNLNMFPYINNLPTGVYIPEDASTGTLLLKLVSDDPDKYPDQTTTTTCTTSPSVDNAKFQYNPGDNTIKLTGIALDYETKDTYIISCKITDGCSTSDGPNKLTVYLQNAIEGLAFNNTDYNCNLKEGDTLSQSCLLPLVLIDHDNFPIVNIGLEPSVDSAKFYFDKSAMRIYLSEPYDVDTYLMAKSVELVLKAVDIAGSSATAPVHVSISDLNDNTCHFSKDVSFTVIDQFTAPGTIDTFFLTDDDLTSPNKDVTVNVVSSRPRDCVNYIEVSSQGVVSYITNFPTSKNGSVCTILIACRDKGVPFRSALATVLVSFTLTPLASVTTTPTPKTDYTSEEENIWDNGWFLAVFSFFMLCAFVGLVAAVAFAMYKFLEKVSPGRVETPRNKITPVTTTDARANRNFSVFEDDNADDFFETSLQYGNNSQRQWGAPRQFSEVGSNGGTF